MCAVKVLVVSMLCGAKFIRRESARSSTMNASFQYGKLFPYCYCPTQEHI